MKRRLLRAIWLSTATRPGLQALDLECLSPGRGLTSYRSPGRLGQLSSQQRQHLQHWAAWSAQQGSQQQHSLQTQAAYQTSIDRHAGKQSGSPADNSESTELVAAAAEGQRRKGGALEALDSDTLTQLRQFCRKQAVMLLSWTPHSLQQRLEELKPAFPAPMVAAIVCLHPALLALISDTIVARRPELQRLLPEHNVDRILCQAPNLLARHPATVQRKLQRLDCLELSSPKHTVELIAKRPFLLGMTVTCSRWRRLRDLAARREAWQQELVEWHSCQPSAAHLGVVVSVSAEAVARLEYLLAQDLGYGKSAYTWLCMKPAAYARHYPKLEQWYAAEGRNASRDGDDSSTDSDSHSD